jgi:hypothetical protein
MRVGWNWLAKCPLEFGTNIVEPSSFAIAAFYFYFISIYLI